MAAECRGQQITLRAYLEDLAEFVGEGWRWGWLWLLFDNKIKPKFFRVTFRDLGDLSQTPFSHLLPRRWPSWTIDH